MKHYLEICVSKKSQEGGIVRCRTVTVREKFLSLLFGEKGKMTILIPGDSVESLTINEIDTEGGNDDE